MHATVPEPDILYQGRVEIAERVAGQGRKVGVGACHQVAGHLLEHLLLRRCGDRTPEEIAQLTDSLGGAVALDIALRYPDLVASLSLIAPAGLGPEIDAGFIDGFIAADRRKAIQPVLARLFVDPGLVSRDMAEDVLRFKRLDGVGAALAAIAAANFPGGTQATKLRERLGEVGVKTQVIWGEGDTILPSRHAQGLPANVAVHVLPGAAHMPHMEKAGEVNRLLLAFLAA